MSDRLVVATEAEMLDLGARLMASLGPGDCVLLEGPLGAGKTTLVRGAIRSLDYLGQVRSPTFNLLHLFATQPPVAHADLYRVESAVGIGLEDVLETHACFIEWPDRLGGLIDPLQCVRAKIEFSDSGRIVLIQQPGVS